MRKAFTLIELTVAVGILAVVMSMAGAIFKFGIDAQRAAVANAEIMQKLRAITDQIDADFAGLRKDGEIFAIWAAAPIPPGAAEPDPDRDAHIRFDRIMFFANGDFQSYRANPKVVGGNLARICYMLANRPTPTGPAMRPLAQIPRRRMLARIQHILTADSTLPNPWAGFSGTDQQWFDWNNRFEYDSINTLDMWMNIPWLNVPPDPRGQNKANILSTITDVNVLPDHFNEDIRGATVNKADPASIHMLLCEGVAEFKVQGWSDPLRRWVPEVDPNADGRLGDDSDFILNVARTALDPSAVPGVLYPFRRNIGVGGIILGGDFAPGAPREFPQQLIDREHFNLIPGLGRALKFTFTLYDSKGIIQKGRTFTHIVYIGD